MPPRISLISPSRLALHPKVAVPRKRIAPNPLRLASDDAAKGPVQENPGEGPGGANETKLPHVTEEQAAMDKIMGEVPPQTEEQGTNVQEILKRDKDAQKYAPKVMQQEMDKQAGQKRPFSTSARRSALEQQHRPLGPADDMTILKSYARKPKPQTSPWDAVQEWQNLSEEERMEKWQELSEDEKDSVGREVSIKYGLIDGLSYPDAGLGHKFPLPDMASWKPTDHLRRRYDPVVDQFTKAILEDGKLSQAQKNVDRILNILRTTPSPNVNQAFPGRALISDNAATMPNGVMQFAQRQTLPLSPIIYLTSVIDSVAPLVKIRHQRGILGGGQSLQLPVPLKVKARRRTAIKWIIKASESKKDVKMADRIGKEIIAVANGTSSVWERRSEVHRTAVTARSNLRQSMLVRRKRP